MPFNTAQAISGMVQSAISSGTAGPTWPTISSIIANACASVFILPGTVSVGPVAGSAPGPGILTSGSPIVGVEPAGMASFISQAWASSGLASTHSYQVALNIATGITQALPSMVVTGTIIGVGPGTGPGKIVGINAVALGNAILSGFTSAGLVNPRSTPQWCTSLGYGIANYINTFATIPVIVSAGPATIPPVPFVSATVASLI